MQKLFLNKKYKNNTKLRDINGPWEKIVNYASDNKTILDKEIYRDPYDYSDNIAKGKSFINKRKEFLKQLPNIEQDNNFANPNKQALQEHSTRNTNLEKESSRARVKISKDKWFKDKKDNIVVPSKEYGGMNCLQKSLSASTNRKNNLYNMKHLVNA